MTSEPTQIPELALPGEPVAVVVFVGTGASGCLASEEAITERFQRAAFGTLAVDSRAALEESGDRTAQTPHAVAVVAEHVRSAADRLVDELPAAGLPVGAFGIAGGATAALLAAARRPERFHAVVACSAHLDLIDDETMRGIECPVLLIEGEPDGEAVERHRAAIAQLGSPNSALEVIVGANGAGDEQPVCDLIADLAAGWFRRHMGSGMPVAVEGAGG